MLFHSILYQFFVLKAFGSLIIWEQLQNISFSLSFLQGIFEKKNILKQITVKWFDKYRSVTYIDK